MPQYKCFENIPVTVELNENLTNFKCEFIFHTDDKDIDFKVLIVPQSILEDDEFEPEDR